MPPIFEYQSNILPATYQPKVLGVLSIDAALACASYRKILGRLALDCSINSFFAITRVMPEGPKFF